MSCQLALLLSSVTFMCVFTATNASNDSDHLALLSFKSMISHDPFGVLNSWNTSLHFCYWEGVTCGQRHQRVTAVNLTSQGLVGYLSPHVGNLTFLRFFVLPNNTFHGNIPPQLGRLFRLQLLDLNRNSFDGEIPSNLLNCSNLIRLWLFHNNLVGKHPEVSSLSKLKGLIIAENKLTGGIPPSVGNITSLTNFHVFGNPLGGRIPHTLGHLKALQRIGLGSCNLSGTIPPSIYNLSLLTFFSLSNNQLSGSLPLELGSMFPYLQEVQLNENQLTGSLPLSISNCSNLEYLTLYRNNFIGKININFARLQNIRYIVISSNKFGSGEPDEMHFIDSLANCSNLEVLEIAENELVGELPYSIGNLSDQIRYIDLGTNQLYGTLPSSIENLVSLYSLILVENQFTGTIPTNIGTLHNIKMLDLGVNRFFGSIPASIGNLSLLIELYLYSNGLGGSIPSSIENCQNLQLLALAENNLGGNIPKQVLLLPSLVKLLTLAQNKLVGPLPIEVQNLKNLNELDLSDNDLSGTIPSSLGSCTSLVSLNLGGNSFQGMIPPELRSLGAMINLDLSGNNLSGKIPKFLEQFSLLSLNLSFNELEGEVPVKGVFANESAISVFGNSRLCGGLPKLQLPKCMIKEEKKKGRKIHLLIILIPIVSVLLASIASYILFICYKKKRTEQGSQSLRNDQFLQVSYNQLLKATNGFSEANLIGVGGFGSVYKGTIVEVGLTVAVKVLNLLNHAAYKSFMAECEALRNIRHRNLCKILSACSSVDFQGNDFRALVYEFMPNGNLENWLHSTPGAPKLSLLHLINILADVAGALDYLHNRCQTPIIHCDLKPSNILLDDNMIAHVGDFGLARFLHSNAHQSSSVGIRGTIGYTAPEYGLGSDIATSGDVYSFGIVLLEITTGKRPTDKMFNENLNLNKFASMALQGHVTDIVDSLILNFDEEDTNTNYNLKTSLHAEKIEKCLVSLVNIGVACSMESPQDRMETEKVYMGLHHIRGVIKNIRS